LRYIASHENFFQYDFGEADLYFNKKKSPTLNVFSLEQFNNAFLISNYQDDHASAIEQASATSAIEQASAAFAIPNSSNIIDKMEELVKKKRKLDLELGYEMQYPTHSNLDAMIEDLNADVQTFTEFAKETEKAELNKLDEEINSRKIIKEKLEIDGNIFFLFSFFFLIHFQCKN
jgi:hypothetical protein